MVKTPSLSALVKSSLLSNKKRLLQNKKFKEKIKLAISVVFFGFAIISYGYLVNISSTKGYFIKTEKEKLSEIKFKNEIVNIDIRKLEAKLFDNITLNSYSSITGKIIRITNVSSVAFK